MELIYFILGALFITIAVPLMDGISTLFLSWIEVAKGRCSLKIAKMSAEIAKLTGSDTGKTQPIGFTIQEEGEEEINEIL